MVYFILLLILLVFSIGEIKSVKKVTLLKVSMFILWVLATFRSMDIGNDTKSYYELFNSITSFEDFFSLSWRYEVGYLFLNGLISILTHSFTIFLGIINAYMYYVYYLFIKKYSKNYMLSVFLFLTMGLWGNTVNIIRLELAITISLNFLIMVDNKIITKKMGVVGSLFVVLFHRISVISVLGYFIPKKINKKFYRLTFAITLFIFLFLPNIIKIVGLVIPYFSEFYLNRDSTYGLNTIKLASFVNMLISFVVFIFGYYIYMKHEKHQKQNKSNIAFQINMVWMSFLILFLSMRFNLIDRCSYYFFTFAIVMIPNVLSYVHTNHNKLILKLIIIIICVVYFVVIIIYRPEWNHIYPYKLFI